MCGGWGTITTYILLQCQHDFVWVEYLRTVGYKHASTERFKTRASVDTLGPWGGRRRRGGGEEGRRGGEEEGSREGTTYTDIII